MVVKVVDPLFPTFECKQTPLNPNFPECKCCGSTDWHGKKWKSENNKPVLYLQIVMPERFQVYTLPALLTVSVSECPLWTFLWRRRLETTLNCRPHPSTSQANGFSPVWLYMWVWREEGRVNLLSQTLHLCFFVVLDWTRLLNWPIIAAWLDWVFNIWLWIRPIGRGKFGRAESYMSEMDVMSVPAESIEPE